jgi:hypothetical protein
MEAPGAPLGNGRRLHCWAPSCASRRAVSKAILNAVGKVGTVPLPPDGITSRLQKIVGALNVDASFGPVLKSGIMSPSCPSIGILSCRSY